MWISARLGDQAFLLYAYADPMAGPSGKGVKLAGDTPTLEEARGAVERPSATVRLAGVSTAAVSAEWVAYLQLPEAPGWMQNFHQQQQTPPPQAQQPPWRSDPLLVGRFHPEYPDDIEATFILVAHTALEKMWVRLGGVVPGVGYGGTLLNTSHYSSALAAGARVIVRPSKSHPPAMWVPDEATAQNLREYTSVCQACGFDLVLTPMAEIIRQQFPNPPPGTDFVQLTTRCMMCRGTMMVARNAAPARA